MKPWKLRVREPSLEELLGDEIMAPVMRSAGLDRAGLRGLLAGLAERLPRERLTPRCGLAAARGARPSAASAPL
ncbi:MAG TPA: hypothetical protein VLX85_03515 [Stellaceae bacterium]|nr:hypothetical protein [Stellaceae bacterium]